VAADWNDLRSPETYLGSDQTANFEGSDGEAPPRLKPNHWGISGDWTIGADSIVLNRAGGRIAYQFHARDIHLVMGPAKPGTTVRFRVLLDGRPATNAGGADVDSDGGGTVIEQRMYQLIRQPAPISDRRFEIEFLDAGVDGYCFTFG